MARSKQGITGKYFILQKDKENAEKGEPPYDRYKNQFKNLGEHAKKKRKKNYYRTDMEALNKQVDKARAMRFKLFSEGAIEDIPEKHRERCRVCNSDQEVKDYIENRYMQWASVNKIITEIKEKFDIEMDRASIHGHCKTFSLDCHRLSTDAILNTFLEQGMRASGGKGRAAMKVSDVIAVLKLRMDKAGELQKQNINVGVNINTPATKLEREEKVKKGLEQFGVGGREIVKEAIAEVVEKVESDT